MNATAGTTIDETQPHLVYSPTPWSADVWFLARDGRCLGWIRRYLDHQNELFGVYTYGCDEQGLRVWISSQRSLNAATAFMADHAGEMLERSRRLGPDPVNPLGLHERR